MSNSYFRFKKFTIYQDACAMKVCTDSCLFGAWSANSLNNHARRSVSILDIGAGTGLLSLMLAQKLPSAAIDAVEIEQLCYQQARRNIIQSPWNQQIQVHHADATQFASQKKYEIIISNPPFYESDLKSRNSRKNVAHHSTGLTLQNFITSIKKYITEEGHFAVLLPCQRMHEFEEMTAKEGFFINKKTLVKQTTKHSSFRVMFLFSKEKKRVPDDDVAIKDGNNNYSTEFISLLKDYYLHL